jgi:hypothetical protein
MFSSEFYDVQENKDSGIVYLKRTQNTPEEIVLLKRSYINCYVLYKRLKLEILFCMYIRLHLEIQYYFVMENVQYCRLSLDIPSQKEYKVDTEFLRFCEKHRAEST